MSPGARTRLMEPYIFCRRKGGVRVCVCFCPRPGGLRVWPATRCQEYRANFHGAAAERQPGHVALVGQPCAMGTGGRQWRAGAGDTVGSRGVQPPRPSTLIQSSRTHCRLGGAPPAGAPKASQLGDVGRIPRSWEAEWPHREGQRMPPPLAEHPPPPGTFCPELAVPSARAPTHRTDTGRRRHPHPHRKPLCSGAGQCTPRGAYWEHKYLLLRSPETKPQRCGEELS